MLAAPPAFTLKTQDGRKVSLADYKGKAVLVNFWATWCVPCKLEMPWFVELHKQYAPQGFEILGVDEDETKDRGQIGKFARTLEATIASATIPTMGWSNTRCSSTRAK